MLKRKCLRLSHRPQWINADEIESHIIEALVSESRLRTLTITLPASKTWMVVMIRKEDLGGEKLKILDSTRTYLIKSYHQTQETQLWEAVLRKETLMKCWRTFWSMRHRIVNVSKNWSSALRKLKSLAKLRGARKTFLRCRTCETTCIHLRRFTHLLRQWCNKKTPRL